MNTTDTPTHPRRSALVRVVADGDGTVLQTPDGELVRLNATARALWELCDGATSPDEMASAVCEIFDVQPDVAIDHVGSALSDLSAKNLLEPAS